MRTLFASLFLASVSLVGCSSDSTPTALGGRLSIDSPSNGSAMNLPIDGKIAVNFTTNYVLKNPNTCAGQDGCGAVYILIDGTACNAQGQPFNVVATSSPFNADLSRCSTMLGQHKITTELHQDHGEFVEDSVTHDPVTSTVTITVQP